MEFVPGDVENTEIADEKGQRLVVQTRRVFCSQCSYLPDQRWAPFRLKKVDCPNCGYHGETKEYYRGGAPGGAPAAAPENVQVDAGGFAHGLGIQSIPLV